jgi:hypothetical protein
MVRAGKTSAAKEFWTGGRKGTLSPMALSQVWALTKMSKKLDLKLTLEGIAKEVWVIGKPRRHPGTSTIEHW